MSKSQSHAKEYMYLAFSKILWNTNLEEHLPHLLFYFLCLTFFYVNQSLKYILGEEWEEEIP